MAFGAEQQKGAVQSGVWPLYRFDPRRVEQGQPPLVVDAVGGKIPVQDYMKNETRFRMVEKVNPEGFKEFAKGAQHAAERKMKVYEHLSNLILPKSNGGS
jgi:pyruvate-ferredoxin/flavodoxin oxidoreductase